MKEIVMQEFDWKNNIENRQEKERLAKKMAQRVKNGEVIGFGSREYFLPNHRRDRKKKKARKKRM